MQDLQRTKQKLAVRLKAVEEEIIELLGEDYNEGDDLDVSIQEHQDCFIYDLAADKRYFEILQQKRWMFVFLLAKIDEVNNLTENEGKNIIKEEMEEGAAQIQEMKYSSTDILENEKYFLEEIKEALDIFTALNKTIENKK